MPLYFGHKLLIRIRLMVLCPYVFLLTEYNTPLLRLQPREVASVHWVPLRALLSQSQRTVTYEDVASKLAKQKSGLKWSFFKFIFGHMLFPAIQLLPSETKYCTEGSNMGREHSSNGKVGSGYVLKNPGEDLLLWGLTLGVIGDFLDEISPNIALEMWTYPTFSRQD